jgi:hypothetical protein
VSPLHAVLSREGVHTAPHATRPRDPALHAQSCRPGHPYRPGCARPSGRPALDPPPTRAVMSHQGVPTAPRTTRPPHQPLPHPIMSREGAPTAPHTTRPPRPPPSTPNHVARRGPNRTSCDTTRPPVPPRARVVPRPGASCPGRARRAPGGRVVPRGPPRIAAGLAQRRRLRQIHVIESDRGCRVVLLAAWQIRCMCSSSSGLR